MATMALGPVVFGVQALPLGRWRRETRYSWSSQHPIGGAPRREFTGLDDDVMHLDVEIGFGIGAPVVVDALRLLAARGESHILADTAGRLYGWWCVRSVHEQVRRIGPSGGRERASVRVELPRTDPGLMEKARSVLRTVQGALGG